MIVFAGPSIAGVDLPAKGIEIRPPVRQGDVYLAAEEGPAAIGIIDGYFEGVPAVWHKEILYALSRGIPVLGASSMGALRAAELHPFGMAGVGEIYRAYAEGELTDDDEVALVHGPEELGHPPLSLAMVNVRATVSAGKKAGALAEELADRIEQAAKAQFYKQRTWESVLDAADAPGETRAWIKANAVDQKRLDAIALLERLAAGHLPRPADFHFVETNLWTSTTKRWRRHARVTQAPDAGFSLFDAARD